MSKAERYEKQAARLLAGLHMIRTPGRTESKERKEDRRRSKGWLWGENIIGIGVSMKRTSQRKVPNQAALTFYVCRKYSTERLPEAARIPEILQLASVGGEVVTDVVELKGRMIGHGPRDQTRPVRPGIEVAHQVGAPGTICAIVNWKNHPGKYALCCSHVVARKGSANEGDSVEQPFDPGSSPSIHAIGTLSSEFSKISFGGRKNSQDHALVKLAPAAVPNVVGDGRVADQVSPLSAERMREGIRTEMFGSRSPGAKGTIRAFESTWEVSFDSRTAVFSDVVAYETTCSPGDSGGAVFERGTRTLLGMHFAGSKDDRFGLFLPLGKLFGELGLTLVKT